MEFGGHRTQRRSAPGATGALIAPHDAVAADRPQVEARDLEGPPGAPSSLVSCRARPTAGRHTQVVPLS